MSLPHDILVEFFRQRPALARELLEACAGLRFAAVTARRESIDLTQVVPAEYRSDAVTVLCDATGAVVAAVIVEVQLAMDEDKRRTWPVYVAAARASLGCPVLLLVLTPDPAVARWASRPIPPITWDPSSTRDRWKKFFSTLKRASKKADASLQAARAAKATDTSCSRR